MHARSPHGNSGLDFCSIRLYPLLAPFVPDNGTLPEDVNVFFGRHAVLRATRQRHIGRGEGHVRMWTMSPACSTTSRSQHPERSSR
jgi:hypothetical protein